MPPIKMQKMEGLLDGLEAADFDDIPSSDTPDPFADLPDLPIDDSLNHDEFFLPPKELPLVGFATGGGKKLAPPSAASLLKARRLLDDPDADDHPAKRLRSEELIEDDVPAPSSSFRPTLPSSTPMNGFAPSGGFMTAGGSQAPPMKASRASILAMFGEEDDQTHTPNRAPGRVSISGFSTAGGSQAPPLKADRVSALAFFDQSDSTAFRSPLRTTTNTFTTPKPKGFVTPKTVRRIGMGTPRNRPAFSAPFKPPAPTTTKVEMVWKPVFDLRPPNNRISMRKFFSGPPGTLTWPHLRQIDSQTASAFQFDDWRGHEQARIALASAGCQLATAGWVQNHWSLIVWKLASQVLARPELHQTHWCFGEVLRQLKYRYEREYGEAQRPIIRRIQEHDSSASLPMVLCVSHIEPEADGAYKVELTDGWYRVGACVDVKLSKAIEKGKIRVGRKLAISGARLSSAEAQSVLEATAKLLISANGCALARWDAKLGRQALPFVSNLTKIEAVGGMIPLLDVYIEKVYAIAHIRAGKMQNNSPWDETEEQEQQDQWNEKYQNTLAQLQADKSKEMDRIKDVVEAIMTYAEGIECRLMDPPDSLEDDFDDLLEASDVFRRIKQFADPHLVHLAQYAQLRLQREEGEKQKEVEAELKTLCPVRDVRNFRVIRVSDARDGYRPHRRIGKINVWDAKLFTEELQEGGRYLVSNVTPGKGQWEWPIRGGKQVEIELHTGRQTQWKQL